MAAIGRVFAEGRSQANPLLVGSVSRYSFQSCIYSYIFPKIKSNIGHTEPASGIAGLMKTILALENGVIPANVGFKSLNPQSEDPYDDMASYTILRGILECC